ncbi:MAG: RbsD/FucU family protein [Hyphomicrobiales bacterium]
MLLSIDPLLTPDLLYVLRAMGHGDELALVDANFPATSVAGDNPLIRLDGVDTARAATAILSVLPLDDFVDQPVRRMQVMGAPDQVLDVHDDMQKAVNAAAGRDWPMGSIERFEFYEVAKAAFAVVATGEQRGYGCFMIKKGVIFPE